MTVTRSRWSYHMYTRIFRASINPSPTKPCQHLADGWCLDTFENMYSSSLITTILTSGCRFVSYQLICFELGRNSPWEADTSSHTHTHEVLAEATSSFPDPHATHANRYILAYTLNGPSSGLQATGEDAGREWAKLPAHESNPWPRALLVALFRCLDI